MMWKLNPAMCGEAQLYFLGTLRAIPLHELGQGAHIVEAMHLYNALRQNGQLVPVWPDFDYFAHITGPVQIFYGDYPRSFEESYRRRLIRSGVSISCWASAHRKREPKARFVQRSDPPDPACSFFRLLSQRDTFNEPWKLEDLEKGLGDWKASNQTKRGGNPQQFSFPQILADINQVMEHRVKHLRVDDYSLFWRCKRLFANLVEEFKDVLKEDITSVLSPAKYQSYGPDHFVTIWVLRMAARDPLKGQWILDRCAPIFKKVIEEEGDVEIKKLGINASDFPTLPLST